MRALLLLTLLSACGPAALTFVVPEGTGGAQVVLADLPPAPSVTFTSPSGRAVPATALFVAPLFDEQQRLGAFTLTRPDEVVEPGRWSVRVDGDEATLRATRFSPELGADQWGLFDARFILPPNCLVDPAAAQLTVQAALDGLRATLAAHHLQLGEVVFEQREVNPCSLFWGADPSLATDAPEVVFIVTNQLEREDLGGFAPVGGTVGVGGSPFGVGALSLEALKLPNVTPSSVVLHELGHWAGLRHSIEADGAVDVLPDTLECAPWDDANHDGRVNKDECWPASANFMFWASFGLGASEAQSLQLRRALTLRR